MRGAFLIGVLTVVSLLACSAKASASGAPPSFAFSVGSLGSGNGQLQHPQGVGTDAKGNLWVADTYNQRLEKFNSNGEYLAQIDVEDSGAGELFAPFDVAVDAEGHVWVTVRMANLLQEFSAGGELLKQVPLVFSEESPAQIVIAPNGNILVNQGWGIYIFNSEGEFIREVAGAWAFAVDSEGDIWETGGSLVQELSPEGELLSQFEPESPCACAIGVDSEGNIWLGDWTKTIREFSPGGEYLSSIGSQGSGAGQFTEEIGDLAIDSKGAIWASDTNGNRVEKWAR